MVRYTLSIKMIEVERTFQSPSRWSAEIDTDYFRNPPAVLAARGYSELFDCYFAGYFVFISRDA